MAYFELEDISKHFAGNTALGGISLSFDQGEFVTILGPSGCGKTTLLNIMAGILKPDRGRLVLQGTDITARPPEKRNFGMVFQNYALFPNLSVRQNIRFGLFRLPRRLAAEKAERLMDLVRLDGLGARYPNELSGGQRQRAALARALATDPAILLLDEPLSALDAQVRMDLGQELLRLQWQTGITTIMVTHDQQEALALADRVVLMHEGRVVQTGTPHELYDAPLGPFAANFIGHMNTLRLPALENGRSVGIRYEDIQVAVPSERALGNPNTWVGKVEQAALVGSCYRLRILLNDFSTRVTADIARAALSPPERQRLCGRGALVAVSFPQNKLWLWPA
ncbi:MAG: ATP-binding cassette domain-containing protein [Deltaproteobacteria bacterium]|jgi:ABC-type Fe3+/spermidine/putrescine transport system ATPase subunit|nr:ATP-binding cassette domain-containing protein [Deltaproteobacteria bacterium]